MKNITKTLKSINQKTLIATVDIGKVKNYGYCRCPDRTEVEPFEFVNTYSGFERFWQQIEQTRRTHQLEKVVVGFESTGPYGEPLIHYLRRRGVAVVQVNPMHTKRLKELQGNSPLKSDQKDPKVIADIMELGHALSVVVPQGAAAELRRLTQARQRAIERRTAVFNQLQNLVWIIFPEFLQVMKDVKTQSAQYLLRHYPTPQQIVTGGWEVLSGELKKISRGKLGQLRAQVLYQAAQASVGVTEGRASLLLEIDELLSLIEASERFIEGLEKELSSQLAQIPYSRWILSLKGIGEVTAAGLIGEVGDFNEFDSLSEITKLAGLDLFEISSGKFRGQRHISKRGRSLLRKLLYFAALNTVRKGGVMHECYQRYLQRGMPKTKALVAIARKLLRIVFALVRDHSEYQTDYLKIQPALKQAA